MATSVNTGWRTVTPGKCTICGSDDEWEVWGDGSVTCFCQRCGECEAQPGWHYPSCAALGDDGDYFGLNFDFETESAA